MRKHKVRPSLGDRRLENLTIRRTGPPLPKQARGYADSAYQSYGRERPNLEFSYKKPKGGELSSEEKEYNRALSRFRVHVEHRIGRVTRSTPPVTASAIRWKPIKLKSRLSPASPTLSGGRPF